ncbi:CvfB family protein [Alteromonas sp. CYL-A6]|uniref:CvfB family protein n=1 Tax=Alteromonas nitratireducens TaxID=3390813 RepID=UPI0034AD6F7E
MINIGQLNTLRVGDAFPFGFELHSLDADDPSTVIYAREDAPETLKQGDEITVFVSTDQQGQLIALPDAPALQRGQLGLLRAVNVTHFGAFFKWGKKQDLLVPADYQERPVDTGRDYLVYVFYDKKTQRLLGATKLHHFFRETSPYVSEGQTAECVVYARTDLGFKVVINEQVLGLLFHSDAFMPLSIGDTFTGVIKHVRSDGKIDVGLQRQDQQGRDALQQAILDDLHAHGGLSVVTDKSRPEDIYSRFQVSKGAYKKALGALYKQKLIIISPDCIKLADSKQKET